MADTGALIVLCPGSQISECGAGLRFEVVAGGQPASAFVVRYRGRVFGYLNRCAHVALELDWVAGQFFDSDGESLLCSTHGAEYGPADGRCRGGPCLGRGGLRPLQVVEIGNVVYWRPAPDILPRPADAPAG